MEVSIQTKQENQEGRIDWRATAGGLVLVGGECRDCGLRFFPARAFCPRCGGEGVASVELARRGKLYSYSTIHMAPKGFATPYTVGFIDLEDGPRVFAQIDGDPDSLELDAAMEPVPGIIRETDSGFVEGYKFRRTE